MGLSAALAVVAGAWALREASTTLVVVTRHAEKSSEATPDPPLADAGIARAERIAALFGASPKGIAIDAIFVTQWQRTLATAQPLAKRLGAPLIVVRDDDVAGLTARILADYRGRRVLVIAHSNTVGPIVRALARGAEMPAIGDVEYGSAYVVAIPRWSRPTVLGVTLP